jgi:hypothetical protein
MTRGRSKLSGEEMGRWIGYTVGEGKKWISHYTIVVAPNRDMGLENGYGRWR